MPVYLAVIKVAQMLVLYKVYLKQEGDVIAVI